MGRFGGFWIACLIAAGLLACRTSAASGLAETPAFVGTWHVLVHYRVADGPHPDRWKWDDRVWVIEPSGEGFEWVEHAIVNFGDQTGRFENLGTPRARRLIGAWEPNALQHREIAEGLTVSSRGMRRKHLERVGPGHWRSAPDENPIGRSASGIGYHEVWSIQEEDGRVAFSIDSRFAVSAASDDESGGMTTYVANEMGTSRFQGRYVGANQRMGLFRADPTRILVPAVRERRERSLLSRIFPKADDPVQLVPDHNINTDVPLLITVLRPFHYYRERRLTIDSTPPGAQLDIAYLRRGSQLMYHSGRAPLEVVLPTRLQSSSADRLLVRGFLPGHERSRRSVAVSEVDESLQLTLAPLENQVTDVAHGSLAGRSVLELRSDQIPTVRVAEDGDGWTIVLVRTGLSELLTEQVAALRDPQLRFEARQLGDDLVVSLRRQGPGPLELRHRLLGDPSRSESRTRIEVDGPEARLRAERLLAAVDGMTTWPDGGCDELYEGVLRQGISDRGLSGLLGHDDHPYRATLRAALRQMARVSPGGNLRATNGDTLTAATPLEFELAWTRSAEVAGYLSWLHAFSLRVDPADDGALPFRSLVAPDWGPDRFDALLARAASARAGCEAPGAS